MRPINHKDPLPEPLRFPPISRGTSLRIPISVIRGESDLFDLTNYNIQFTLKKYRADFDYDDDRAFISRIAELVYDQQTPPQPIKNRLDIKLTSQDTWLPEGDYYFDLELINKTTKTVTRFGTFITSIIGGPTNKTFGKEVLSADSKTFFYSDGIKCRVLENGQPIVVVTPITSQVPDHLVENITANPDYIWNKDKENPELYIYSSRCDFITSKHVELSWINSGAVPSNYIVAFEPGSKIKGWSDSMMNDAKFTVNPSTNIATLELEDNVYLIQIFRRGKPVYRLETDPDNPGQQILVEKTKRINNIIEAKNTNKISFVIEDTMTDFTMYIRKFQTTNDNQQEFFSKGEIFSDIETIVSAGAVTTTITTDWLLKSDWICLGKER